MSSPKKPIVVLVALLATAVVAGLALWSLVGVEEAGSAAEAVAVAPAVQEQGTLDAVARPERVSTGVVDLSVPGGIEIPAGVRLAGPGRLEGRVLDRVSGAALPGMRVDLHALPPAGARLIGRFLPLVEGAEAPPESVAEPVATTGTDGSGSFVFDGVRAGNWYIEARGAHHVPDSITRARVTGAGQEEPLDVYVRAGGRVLGVVLLPSGEPAVGATVTVSPGLDDLLASLKRGDLCFLETQTGGEGRFVLAGVPPGESYDVHALRTGFAPSHAAGVVVRAGEDTAVTLRTQLPARVEGRVVSVGTPGQAAAPLAGAHVAAIPEGLRYLPFSVDILEQTHVVTDGEGRYVMTQAPPGDIVLLGIAAEHIGAIGPKLALGEGASAIAADFELPVGPTVAGRVVDGAGAPLAGVEVEWQPLDADEYGFDASFAPLVARGLAAVEFPRTGADGRFTAGAFPGDPPYWITFSKPGYADKRYSFDPAGGDSDVAEPPEEGTEAASADEGEAPDEIEITLVAGGYVEGIVMDVARTEPLRSYTIHTSSLIADEEGLAALGPFGGGTLVEDAGGRFRIGPLEPGTVELTFDAPGYTAKEIGGLDVAEGETHRGVIVEMNSGGAVHGTVVNESGVGVAGALVFTRLLGAPPAQSSGDTENMSGPRRTTEMSSGLLAYAAQLGLFADEAVRSGPGGHFELEGVDPGRHVAVAVHRAYATSASESFEVAEGDAVAEVRIVLPLGGAIFGKVTDRFERPIPGAIVLAAAPGEFESEDSYGSAVYQGRTDEGGAYRIDNVSSGTYFLLLTRADEAQHPMSFLGTLNFDMVTVPEGERVEFDIVDASVGGTRVFGRVIVRGEEVTGGQITAMGFEAENMLGLDLKVARVRAGRYEFEGLVPGEYQLQIEGVAERGVKMTIDVPDLPEYQLDLTLPDGRISGRVVDAASGAPLPGTWVTALSSERVEPQGMVGQLLSQNAGALNDWTDDDGAFEFARLEDADYEIGVRRAELDGERFAPMDPLVIAVRDDRSVEGVELRLEPALRIEGTVSGGGGVPIAGARVVAWLAGRPESAEYGGETDADGHFVLGGLAPGSWTVSASHDDYAEGRVDAVELTREGAQPVEIALQPGVLVSVRVIGTNGRPVSGATGLLTPVDGEEAPDDLGRLMGGLMSGAGVSDAEGTLELGRYVPGAYRLQVRRGFARSDAEVVTIDAGGPARLRARLR